MGIGMSAATIAVRVAAEFGEELSGDRAIATLPTGLQVVGIMLSGLICSRAMARFGRKPVLLVGLSFGILAGLVGVLAAVQQSYYTLFPAHFFLGVYLANIALLRFTAADQVMGPASARAISLTLFGGVIAAFVGPGFVFAADLISSTQYYGISYGFIALVSACVLTLIAVTPIKNNAAETAPESTAVPTDTATDTATTPRAPTPPYMSYAYITAVLTGSIGYGVMALLMTAAALYMKELNMAEGPHRGHFGNNVRTFAIMWHVVAMFGPMIILPRLADLIGLKSLMMLGAGLLILSAAIGIGWNTPVAMYAALIVLGLGWAATYGTGGIVVKKVVADEARFVAQGRNEFTVAFMAGVGSIGAGFALKYLGWEAMNWMAILMVAILIPLIAKLNLSK